MTIWDSQPVQIERYFGVGTLGVDVAFKGGAVRFRFSCADDIREDRVTRPFFANG